VIKTIELVPSSIRSDPQVIAACEAIDIELEEIYSDIPEVAFWTRLDQVVPPLLDVLSWEYHVDLYEMLLDGRELTNDEKRKLIDLSIIWHQKKGTKWIVEQVLKTAWPTASVTEWYQYGGQPYYFRIVVDEDIAGSPELYQRVVRAIMAVKNVRSWLDPAGGFIRPVFSRELNIFVGGLTTRRKRLRIPSYNVDDTPGP